MKVESSWLISWLLWARASKSCLIRADFSCSNWVMRSLLSVTSCTRQGRKMLVRGGNSWQLVVLLAKFHRTTESQALGSRTVKPISSQPLTRGRNTFH